MGESTYSVVVKEKIYTVFMPIECKLKKNSDFNFARFSGKGRHILYCDTLSKVLEREFSCAN